MSGDLISRSALLEKVWDAETRCGYVQVVDVGDIETAPAVEAELEWISVTERLPGEEDVIVVARWYGKWEVMQGWYLSHSGVWGVTTSQGDYQNIEVCKWMPYPQLPKEITDV